MTDDVDRLAEIITVLDGLDVAAALAGIRKSLPGWPTGGRGGGTKFDPDTGEPEPELTKVEAVAITPDPAKTAERDYPRLCASLLRASEAVTGLSVTRRDIEPSRMVLYAGTLLRVYSASQSKPDHRQLHRLWHHTMTLRDETQHWATIANATGVPPKDVGLVEADDRWCTSCLRIGVCEPRSQHHTRCRWCLAWHAVHQADPPVELLRLRQDGIRLTSKVIEEALGKPRRRSVH